MLDKYNKNYSVILVGDLNARVGNNPIPKLIGPYGEPPSNRNGEKLRKLVTYDLKITNGFFKKKDIGYTNILGQQEVQDQL